MSAMITYVFWYVTILGTGVYFLANSIRSKRALPKIKFWRRLWNLQLASGIAMTSFPFVHLWVVGHII